MKFCGEPWLPEEIAKLIDIETRKKADAVLRDQKSWPPWFKELYEEEVKKKVSAGLNQEFNSRVETAAVSRAQQRLNELTTIEWPAWRQANIDPKVVELESRINANVFQLLRGPWIFTCNQCGTSSNAELTAGEIEQLLRTGQIKVACSNPDCEDHSLFSTRRHTFQVSLYNLIEGRIAG